MDEGRRQDRRREARVEYLSCQLHYLHCHTLAAFRPAHTVLQCLYYRRGALALQQYSNTVLLLYYCTSAVLLR